MSNDNINTNHTPSTLHIRSFIRSFIPKAPTMPTAGTQLSRALLPDFSNSRLMRLPMK